MAGACSLAVEPQAFTLKLEPLKIQLTPKRRETPALRFKALPAYF
jgi:hypothetical protein